MCIFIISKYTKVNDDAEVEREMIIIYYIHIDSYIVCFSVLPAYDWKRRASKRQEKTKRKTIQKKYVFFFCVVLVYF